MTLVPLHSLCENPSWHHSLSQLPAAGSLCRFGFYYDTVSWLDSTYIAGIAVVTPFVINKTSVRVCHVTLPLGRTWPFFPLLSLQISCHWIQELSTWLCSRHTGAEVARSPADKQKHLERFTLLEPRRAGKMKKWKTVWPSPGADRRRPAKPPETPSTRHQNTSRRLDTHSGRNEETLTRSPADSSVGWLKHWDFYCVARRWSRCSVSHRVRLLPRVSAGVAGIDSVVKERVKEGQHDWMETMSGHCLTLILTFTLFIFRLR